MPGRERRKKSGPVDDAVVRDELLAMCDEDPDTSTWKT